MTVDKNSFAAFWKANPEKGLDYIVRLRDVTGDLRELFGRNLGQQLQ